MFAPAPIPLAMDWLVRFRSLSNLEVVLRLSNLPRNIVEEVDGSLAHEWHAAG